jgi:thiamine pyrophosphate-dependent acetolactate synthase large subunit-like protein
MVPAERHITAEADQVVAALLADFQANPLDAAVEAGPVAAVEAAPVDVAPVDVAPVDVAPVDVAERRARIGAETARARRNWRETAAKATGDGVVPLDRLLFELARALEGTDFVLGGGTNGRHEHKFLALDRPRQYAGWAAGGGLGYGVGGALGVALAQPPGTVTVDVQADGDLLYLPSALWTAAHKSLPVLIVVHNNRQYGNTVEHAQRIAAQRGHDDSRRYEGAGLADPPVDLAAMARSFGVWAAGPIGGPDDLAERLAEAVAVVRDGRPALLDVLTPGF